MNGSPGIYCEQQLTLTVVDNKTAGAKQNIYCEKQLILAVEDNKTVGVKHTRCALAGYSGANY